MKARPRPRVQTVYRLTGPTQKPKFRILLIDAEGRTRQCTWSLIRADDLPELMRMLCPGEGGEFSVARVLNRAAVKVTERTDASGYVNPGSYGVGLPGYQDWPRLVTWTGPVRVTRVEVSCLKNDAAAPVELYWLRGNSALRSQSVGTTAGTRLQGTLDGLVWDFAAGESLRMQLTNNGNGGYGAAAAGDLNVSIFYQRR